jgi:excisionase family DNA binding protein
VLAAPPTLAALLDDPARAADVPAAEVPKLIVQCGAEHHRLAALETALASRLAPGEREGTAIGDALTVEDVARRTGMSVAWLYRELRAGRLPFARRHGRRVKFDPVGLKRWLDRRPAR